MMEQTNLNQAGRALMAGTRHSSKAAPTSSVTQVFLKHGAFLKKFLMTFLHHKQDVEDVAQEAYLRAYSTELNRGELEQPKALLFTIAKNLALNELARKSRQIERYIHEAMPDDALESVAAIDTVENEIEAQQTLALYCQAVATLPEDCRRVYLLRKVHGLPHSEIAQQLQMSRSSVEKHLRMGIQVCRDYMLRNADRSYVTVTPRVAGAPKQRWRSTT
jgi:RNA polymerase sigma-70 factor (ECF subfamily)